MVRVGIIGGGIRGSMYARSLAEHPDAEVVAVCDVNRAAAEHTATPLGLRTHPDHRSMLSEEALDAVIVATPDFAHTEPVVDAAAHGLHLLVEKPVATTSDEVATITKAVERAGVQCMVGFENRWNPPVLQLHDLAVAGELGDVLTQNVILSNTYHVPTRMLSWAARSSPAWFLMSHTVDAVTWVADKRVAEVVARGSRGVLAARGIDTWDVVHALLTFGDGTTANLTSSWVLPESLPSVVDFKYHVVGSEGSVDLDLQDQGLRHAGANYRWPATLGGEVDGRLQGAPAWMAQSFVSRLAAGEAFTPDLAEGATVSEVVLAILESLRSGEKQPVASAPPETAR